MAQRKGRPRGVTPDGPKLRRLRVELGLTAVQVAEKVGVDAQSIRRSERGFRVDPVIASRLAKVLGVSMSDISDWPPSDDAESGAETKIPA